MSTGVVNIRGKQYVTVARRVQDFRGDHPHWSIVTTILDRNAEMVLMRAEITDESGRVLAAGHAEEWREASQINQTSAVENAETSAIGRALACLGYLGGGEFASAEEIEIAVRKKVGMSAAEVNLQEFQALPADAQQVVREHALEVIAYVEEGKVVDAVALIERDYSAQEDRMAIWSQLPSGVRSTLKKAMRQAA